MNSLCPFVNLQPNETCKVLWRGELWIWEQLHNKQLHARKEGRISCQPLTNIPLRSMLVKAERDTIINSQSARSGTSFNIASTGTRKSTTCDFDLLVYNHLANHSRNRNKPDSTAHDEMTWHARL
jgi:hypothetical protein